MTVYGPTIQLKEEHLNKIKGGIVGFMIGDALGMPVAGIPKNDIHPTISKISSFVENPGHPLLYFLKKGQYGGNSRLLLTTLQSILFHKRYDHLHIIKELKQIAVKSKEDMVFSRWMGETIMQSLISGVASNTDSCTCIYLVIPIALLYNDLETVIRLSVLQSQTTHISSVSLSASVIVSYILFHLIHQPNDLKEIVSKAIGKAEHMYGTSLLTTKLKMILDNQISSLHQARKVFGTGSRAHQVIPLSLYIAINNVNDFKKGVLDGVHSFREDTHEESQKLEGLSYKEALIHARGGDTNAIGGLVGCLLGTINGYTSIHNEYKKQLEDESYIISLIDKAVTS